MNKKAAIIGGSILGLAVLGGIGYYVYTKQNTLATQSGGGSSGGSASGGASSNLLNQVASTINSANIKAAGNAVQQVYQVMKGQNQYQAPSLDEIYGTQQITVAQLKSIPWYNKKGAGPLGNYIAAYDANTNIVKNIDAGWTGQLVSLKRIEWKKNNGEQDTWTAA